jgi:hypothetical protein
MCHSIIGRPERLGDLARQFGLAGAGLALDQQRAFQRDGGVDRDRQIVGRDIGVGAGKFHGFFPRSVKRAVSFRSEQDTKAACVINP